MSTLFAETLRKLRAGKGFSQKEMADRLYVTRSTVARWENGSRLPDAAMITRLARCLDVDAGILFSAVAESDDIPNVIMVEDRSIILTGGLQVLEEVL
ncbi:MAG: helix-turn-helix transcriptional regulator, partial [Oscillospiraceae bacterium]|nr:helix-turn-helix transcriptional regulator [Oscillospiraceae bacterium]